MKKKEYTPKQQLTRFFVGVGLVAVMLLFIMIPKKDGRSPENPLAVPHPNELRIQDSVSLRMNELLDSVNVASLIGETPVFEGSGPWKMKTEENIHEMEIDALNEMLLNDTFESIRDAIIAQRDSLVALDKETPVRSYYWREVFYVEKASGRRFRIIQTASDDLNETTISNVKEIGQ